jgi:hypothetical protein
MFFIGAALINPLLKEETMNLSTGNNKPCGICITDPTQLILMSPRKAKDCSSSCLFLQTICAALPTNGDDRAKKCQEAAEEGIKLCSMCHNSRRQSVKTH